MGSKVSLSWRFSRLLHVIDVLFPYRWVYIEHRFEVGTTLHSFCLAKFVIKEKNGKTIPFEDYLKRSGFQVTEEDIRKKEVRYSAAEGLIKCEEGFLSTLDRT